MKRGKRNAAAASASPGYVAVEGIDVSQLAADDGNVFKLAAHGGNDLRTLQLTSHDEVVEKDIQGVGFTRHAYSKLAEVYGIRAKLAERELSVLNEARLQDSNWAHHASMSQHVSMALESICYERGSTKTGSVGYDVQGATVESSHPGAFQMR